MTTLVKRLTKGTALTFEDMDGNFDKISSELNARPTVADSSISIINAVLNLKSGVAIEGDTLNKLYSLIVQLNTNKINKTSIVNNLTDDDYDSVLSGLQGRVLKENLNTEITNRINSVFIETNRATNVENILRSDLSKESTNRLNNDNLLDSKILNILNTIETSNLTNLYDLITTLQISVSNEINARTDSINQEVINRQSAIDSETTNRILEDSKLNARIDNLLANTDQTALNSLSEIVEAFQTNDNNILSSLNSLSTASTSGLSEEILNRTNADNLEIITRTSAITDAINAETIDRNKAIVDALALLESRMYSI